MRHFSYNTTKTILTTHTLNMRDERLKFLYIKKVHLECYMIGLKLATTIGRQLTLASYSDFELIEVSLLFDQSS